MATNTTGDDRPTITQFTDPMCTWSWGSEPVVRRFVADYGPVAAREVAELYDLTRGKAVQMLQSPVDDGLLRREPRGNGLFWHAAGGGH